MEFQLVIRERGRSILISKDCVSFKISKLSELNFNVFKFGLELNLKLLLPLVTFLIQKGDFLTVLVIVMINFK